MENKAISLFKLAYGKTPQEAGFSVIDIYEKQNAFLYAVSEETIKAYKTQQNILRFIMLWYMWPLLIMFINFYDALITYQDPLHQRCITSYVFCGIWFLLAIILYIKVWQTSKIVKLGKTITYFKYA